MLLVFGCTAENTIVKKVDSPSGEYVAYPFIRDAGATTDFSTQVSILKKSEKYNNRAGNIFIGSGSEFINIYWESDNNLVIVHDRDKRDIFKKVQKNIIYQLNMC